MTLPTYAPGQRWISNTESELGLGIIVEYANRRITLSFPATGESRTYAENNAPISRVQYHQGEQVTSLKGDIITVTNVLEHNGCLIYSGNDANGNHVILPELELDCCVHFNTPLERLLAGQVDNLRRFQLRQQTLNHYRRLQQSSVQGLIGPRVELLPHQLYIAHEVANRYAPRVLLADEVGLGKTIEAGLILHQQLISGRASRVLIVVPDSLVHQWLVEMLRRFNLHFTILNEQRCEDLQSSSTPNPFESAQLVLCSLSLLEENDNYLHNAANCEWDLLIVDEAHHLTWSETQVSTSYQKIEQLAQCAKGLLLLTATPEQLGIESHFARLRLIDPDRFYDLQRFRDGEARYQQVNEVVQHLLTAAEAGATANESEYRQPLREYLGSENAENLLKTLQTADQNTIDTAVKQAVQALLDRHGTGRVLFRNTRSAVKGFPQRVLHRHPLTMPQVYRENLVGATLAQRLHPEQLLDNAWTELDPRMDWLVDWLKQQRSEKALLICASADTALNLEEHLRLRVGVRSALFHEHMSLLERDRAAAYFADDIDGAQVLVCSEIGSEGRNFQFAQHLMLFDLPINPDLLEQRIGRLDRIGQRHNVNIHVPYYQHSPQEALLRWYDEGVNAFERACPAGQAILERFSTPLQDCLTSDLNTEDAHKKLDALIQHTASFTEEMLQTLQNGRDRLLELNSCNMERANEVVDILIEEELRRELADYMEKVFDEYGVDHEYHSENAIVIRPSDHMHCHHFPSLPEDGLTATYQRTLALSREDMHFLTWEHPMVSGAMDMVLNDEFGNTALCSIKLPPLKPGTLLAEAIFVINCAAPKSLQLQRHLPLSTIRIIVDSNNNDLSNVISFEHINKLGEKVPKRVAQDLVRHTRADITELVKRSESLAQKQHSTIIEAAIEQMQAQQNAELQRLQALSEVNPNIRQEEINYIKDKIETMKRYLQSATIKLDALRIAVTT